VFPDDSPKPAKKYEAVNNGHPKLQDDGVWHFTLT
jgi:hypothetical protein